MFAALPMYDHPGVQDATDALWAGIRNRLRGSGIPAPDELSRGEEIHGQWRDPKLLLGQACGLPFRTELRARVTLVGAIDYGLPDTPPGYYHSYFIARAEDPRSELEAFGGAALAFSDPRSHSGWAVACEAPVRFRVGPVTGSHLASCKAVAEGAADIAAVDAISFRLIREHTGLARRLKPVGRSEATPGMALITAFPEHRAALAEAISGGIAALSDAARAALGARAFVEIPAESYHDVANPPSPEAYSASTA